MLLLYFLEGGDGEDVDHAAVGAELLDSVLANILMHGEGVIRFDDIDFGVDDDAHFQCLCRALELFGFELALAADAAALPIGFAFLCFLNGGHA